MNELSRPGRGRLTLPAALSSLLLRSIWFQAEDLLPPIAFPEGEAANDEETDETADANRLFAQVLKKGVIRGSGENNVWHQARHAKN